MIRRIQEFYKARPLTAIILVGAVLRLISAVFSKGYAMHDDHFCVIEVAQRWADGYGDWIGQTDSLRSVIYPGLHFLLFKVFDAVGVSDPQAKMFFVRLLHAAYSLLIIYFGYNIMLAISSKASAKLAGWILAAFWLMPFMSVRNLIEFVCIVPLMAGTWLILDCHRKRSAKFSFYSGAIFGIAFAFRFQTALFCIAIWLLLMLKKEWRNSAFFAGGICIAAIALQGSSDWLAYGYPFASLLEYIRYNSGSAYAYVTGPWHQYIGLLAGILIPPISLLFIYGWLWGWKKHALIFWPSFLYFVFHSYYPGKQERFILPILPFLIMGGIAWWDQSALRARVMNAHARTQRGFWIWFWAVNILLLSVFTPTYVKKSRCETLSRIRASGNVRAIVCEGPSSQITQPPKFYVGTSVPFFYVTGSHDCDSLLYRTDSAGVSPNYFIFVGDDDLDGRTEKFQKLFPGMSRICRIDPGLLDAALHAINPKHNKNFSCYIYKTD